MSRKLWCGWVEDGGFLLGTIDRDKKFVEREMLEIGFFPPTVVRVKIVEVLRPPKARRTKP